MSGLVMFLVAMGGGLAGEFLGIWGLRKEEPKGLPHWLTSRFYWACVLGMALAGGCLALLYRWQGEEPGPILTANIGASAPLILAALASRSPHVPTGPTN